MKHLFPLVIILMGCIVNTRKDAISELQYLPELPEQKRGKYKVMVEQEYDSAVDVTIPVEDVLHPLMKNAGFELAGDEDSSDFTIKAHIRGMPIAQYYSQFLGVVTSPMLYTGAMVSGEYEIDSAGIRLKKDSFKGIIDPPHRIYGTTNYENPSSAPFEPAFYKSGFFEKIGKFILQKYGIDAAFKYWEAAFNEGYLTNNALDAFVELKDTNSVRFMADNFLKEPWFIKTTMKKMGPHGVKPLLQILTKDSIDISTRAMAAEILGDLQDKRALPALQQTVTHSNLDLKVWSAYALYKLGDLTKLDLIIQTLKNNLTNCNLAQALGAIGNKKAIQTLVETLDTEYEMNMKGQRETCILDVLCDISKEGETGSCSTNAVEEWWQRNKDYIE